MIMKDFYQQIMEEHPDVDKKVLSKFLKSFTYPNITLNSDFSLSLKKKISRKIRQMDEKNYLEYLKLIPARIKFRYRLGGFAAAMFAFLFIFVVVFFSDFFSDQLFVPSKYIQVDSKFETPDTDNMKNNLMESRMMFVDAMLF